LRAPKLPKFRPRRAGLTQSERFRQNAYEEFVSSFFLNIYEEFVSLFFLNMAPQ
jgi:hypothetical protein